MNKEVIDFKSVSEYFKDEKLGLKNHTEREIDITDKKFQSLLCMWKDKEYGIIRINSAEYCHDCDKAKEVNKDGMNSFMRDIQHIAVWGNIMSIT